MALWQDDDAHSQEHPARMSLWWLLSRSRGKRAGVPGYLKSLVSFPAFVE
jgi:hypothetical protein